MKQIKNVDEAIKFLIDKANISVEIVDYKYRIYDEDFNDAVKDDKALIEYAQEQQEALGEE